MKGRDALKKGVREKFAEITEIPKDFLMNMPRITLLGNRELHIDNYKGLLEYTNELISVASTNKIIIVKGNGLIITRIVEKSVYIGGNILSVEFTNKNKK